jgi:uncharacterized protein YceH (UPF0502 family)
VPAEPDAVEIRVVACLVEKQRTTPDVYPLSLNAIRIACNQSTNRDPVVAYDEQTVSDALRRTALRGWTRLTSGAGSRARKYRQLLDEALGVDSGELAVLAVLMLRGPQTPGELKQRTERLEGFADLGAVNGVLERLIERGFVIRHPRRAGQKEERYEQVLGGTGAEANEPVEPVAEAPAPDLSGGEPFVEVAETASPSQAEGEIARLDRLEADLLDLKGEIARLREALGD